MSLRYYEKDCRAEYIGLCEQYQRLHSAKEQLALYLGTQQQSDENGGLHEFAVDPKCKYFRSYITV